MLKENEKKEPQNFAELYSLLKADIESQNNLLKKIEKELKEIKSQRKRMILKKRKRGEPKNDSLK